MKQLTKLKTLLEIPAEETGEDNLLSVLLLQARAYIRAYCRLGEEDAEELEKTEPLYRELAVLMAAEDYGRMGSEGLEKRSASGVSETYHASYSPRITEILRRFRRLHVPGGRS